MTTIASRDLRNHTAAVLRQVADGVEVTVTVHGKPVALITRARHQRSAGVSKADLLDHFGHAAVDRSLAADLAWISAGTTDDLGPLR